MHAWTNDNTGHNRTIDTGPTPDGKVSNLLIKLSYIDNGGGVTDKAVNLDGHIIPLILRVPEMRDTLRECAIALESLGETYGTSVKMIRLLQRIEALTAPTREEAEQGA